MPKKSSPTIRIRSEYPTVDYLPSNDCYLIHAEKYDYPGKKSGQYKIKDRAKALAKAEEIAALVADVQHTGFTVPSMLLEKFSTLGISPFEILRQHLITLEAKATNKHLEEAYVAFVAAKRAQKLRVRYLKSVLPEVEKFVAETGASTPLQSINLACINDYLISNSPTAGTHQTKLKHLTTFFNFCKDHKWITENPADFAPSPKVSIEVHVTHPRLVRCLLESTFSELREPAASAMRAYIALAAFAGIRPEEIHRLDWRDIHLDQSLIYISKTTSKINDDRETPITPNCKAWLLTCEPRVGLIQPKSSLSSRFHKIRTHCGIETWRHPGEPWPHDVLRHTFASSWLAIHKNRPLLAEIMGNSVRIITRHYKRTISLAQAEALFAILPPG